MNASYATEVEVTTEQVADDTGGDPSSMSSRLCEENPAGSSASFVLVEFGERKRDSNPVIHLNDSSVFCKIPVSFELVGSVWECRVGGDLVGTGYQDPDSCDGNPCPLKHIQEKGSKARKRAAKAAAAAEAISVLKKRCYTIRPKSTGPLDSEDGTANRQTALGAARRKLRKCYRMLWQKSLTFNSESVLLEELIGMEGIDAIKRPVTAEFEENTKLRLREYASNFQDRCLLFSNDFNNDEWKAIETIAQSLNLKSENCGNGEERCLVVSHKNRHHLVQYLKATGGQADECDVIPPGGDTNVGDNGQTFTLQVQVREVKIASEHFSIRWS